WGLVGIAAALRDRRNEWPLIAALSAVAAIGLVPMLWDLPLLNRVQFPWRVLEIAEFAAITAAAIATPRPLVLALSGALMLRALFPFAATAHWGYGHRLEPELIAARVDGLEYLLASAKV